MSGDRIKHFEELWEESEQLASKVVTAKNDSPLQLMEALIKDYINLTDSDLPEEVVKSLKNRYMGEIVFLLTAVSKFDNINVYAALMEEIKLNS